MAEFNDRTTKDKDQKLFLLKVNNIYQFNLIQSNRLK